MATIATPVKCPHCGKNLSVDIPAPEIPDGKIQNPVDLAPPLAAKGLRPVTSAFVYKINTSDIHRFITDKAQQYAPNAEVVIQPTYCERKKRYDDDEHRSYAFLNIAYSEDVAVRAKEGWFNDFDGSGDVNFVETMYKDMIQRYSYDPKALNIWLKSYKKMDSVARIFGMSEEFIHSMKKYCTPQCIKANNGKRWIFVNAAPELIIRDMLSDTEHHQPIGQIKIKDVYQISKDAVEFIVYVYPQGVELREDQYVREIMMGSNKK